MSKSVRTDSKSCSAVDFAAIESLEKRRLFTTWYVSANGDDDNAGTSANNAWRTIAQLNRHDFVAGDKILFEGGDQFTGRLYLGPRDRGTASKPINIGSYGTGRASIAAGNAGAIFVYDTAGISISNLQVVGPGDAATGKAAGITFFNNLPHGVKLKHVYIDNVESSGFAGAGISVGSWNGKAGFSDVRITNSVVHDNIQAGLVTYAQALNAHQHVYIGKVEAYNNVGNSTTLNSGSGIMLGGVRGATVEACIAHDNAANGDGAVGIWTYDSSYVLIEHSESYSNHTTGKNDGDGFDFDRNVTNSIMQYNWAHDNDGSGFELAQNGKAGAYYNNTLRSNSSENDGKKNGYGAIDIWGPVANCVVENNIVYTTEERSVKAIRIINPTANVQLRNNYFQATAGPLLLDIAPGQKEMVFADNNAVAPDDAVSVTDGYTVYPDLRAWTTRFTTSTV